MGKTQSSITVNDRAAISVDIILFKDGFKHLIGRGVFPHLNFSIQQSTVDTVELRQHECPHRKQIHKEFPGLVTRIGKSNNFVVRLKFHSQLAPTHQKRPRVPINLKLKVNIEIYIINSNGRIEIFVF